MVDRTCEWCGETFQPKQIVSTRPVQRFCGNSCVLAWSRARKPQGVTMHPHTCEVCGKDFESHKRQQRTCGHSCRGALAGGSARRVTVCPCGAETTAQQFCTDCARQRNLAGKRDHYARNREAIRVRMRQHYAANKDVFRDRAQEDRDRTNFNGLRRARLEVDGFACGHCHATENLVVHHLNRREDRDEPDTTSTIDDLLTLCRRCHMKEHQRLGHLQPS